MDYPPIEEVEPTPPPVPMFWDFDLLPIEEVDPPAFPQIVSSEQVGCDHHIMPLLTELGIAFY